MSDVQALYLDHAATTPLVPGVAERMQEVLAGPSANPASAHPAGRAAAAYIADAARAVGELINADADSLVWTSGATESINLALKGVVGFNGGGGHLVTVATEHAATLDVADWLAARGTRVTRLGVDVHGRIDLAEFETALADDATLASIMHVNNETGVIQDIEAIGRLCECHDVALHVDAAQSLGRLPIDVQRMNIALLSMSAHKLGGPQGIGALYVRSRPRVGLSALIHGGGQQGGRRSGTLATHQIAGFGAAAEWVASTREGEQTRLAGLRDALWASIEQRLPGVHRNGDSAQVAAPFLNVSVDDVHGEALRVGLTEGQPSLAVSSGAACSAARGQSSYVLRAQGRSPRLAAASIRFCLGADIDRAGAACAADRFVAEVQRLRALGRPAAA
ncbi:cysteine desulfurase family protein [Salinisphaera sp. T31B1]|uniref:cysteine desulfurase family protein n=1 Tax=Salinisphaera sp. T31B1 TaxID=727963 RepID=UPI00333F08E2